MRGLILFLALSPLILQAQSWQEKYRNAINNHQDSLATSILMQWIDAEPENPEMTVAAFNHYLFSGIRDILVMTDDPGKFEESEEYLQLLDADGLPFTYIGSDIYYEPEYFNKAMYLIDEGIKFNPDRLDLRFGKAHILGETQNYEIQVETIKQILARNKINGGIWNWMENAPVDDTHLFLPESIQDYIGVLFYSGPSYGDEIIEISNLILEQFPDHVMYLSNIGAVHYNNGELKKALESFEEAYKIDQKDVVVLLNLALIHEESGNKKDALNYYEQVTLTGDEYDREFALEKIDLLKGKEK